MPQQTWGADSTSAWGFQFLQVQPPRGVLVTWQLCLQVSRGLRTVSFRSGRTRRAQASLTTPRHLHLLSAFPMSLSKPRAVPVARAFDLLFDVTQTLL